MDDIVKRLRADDLFNLRGPEYEPIPVKPSALRIEAAEEIERLRAVVRALVAEAKDNPPVSGQPKTDIRFL